MSQQTTVQHLLSNWRPPILKDESKKGSKGTRSPAYLDSHLDDYLLLKRIVVDNSLIQECKNTVDAAMKQHGDANITIFTRVPQGSPAVKSIESEAKLELFYQTSLMPLVNAVACAVYDGSSSQQEPFIDWQRTASANRTGGAIADGFLQLSGAGPDRFGLKMLKNILVWEFKRPEVAHDAMLTRIANIAQGGAFAWCRCSVVNGSESKTSFVRCSREKHYTRVGEYVFTRAPMGPDCLDLPQGLPHVQDQQFRSITSNANGVNDVDKAHHMLQQLWINAVMSDATYMVLSSGKNEFIGRRHRETQTLMLTPVITPADENACWLKIMAGLHLLALDDAVKRGNEIALAIEEGVIHELETAMGGFPPPLEPRYAEIVSKWKAIDSHAQSPIVKSNHVQRTRKETALNLLLTAPSIILVLPLLERLDKLDLIRNELPYVWKRWDPLASKPEPAPPTTDMSDQVRTCIQPALNVMRDFAAEEIARNPSLEEIYRPKTRTGESQYTPDYIHYSIHSSGEAVGPIPGRNEQGVYDLLGDHQATISTTHIGNGLVELFGKANADLPAFSYRTTVRYDGRYLLDEEVEVKVVTVGEFGYRSSIHSLEQEYKKFKRTEEIDNRIKVYGLFGYNHTIPEGDKDRAAAAEEDGFQKYRLATTEDWVDVPHRYLALVTGPLGVPLHMLQRTLTSQEVKCVTEILTEAHKQNLFHGSVEPEDIRIFPNGTILLINWISKDESTKLAGVTEKRRAASKLREQRTLKKRISQQSQSCIKKAMLVEKEQGPRRSTRLAKPPSNTAPKKNLKGKSKATRASISPASSSFPCLERKAASTSSSSATKSAKVKYLGQKNS